MVVGIGHLMPYVHHIIDHHDSLGGFPADLVPRQLFLCHARLQSVVPSGLSSNIMPWSASSLRILSASAQFLAFLAATRLLTSNSICCEFSLAFSPLNH